MLEIVFKVIDLIIFICSLPYTLKKKTRKKWQNLLKKFETEQARLNLMLESSQSLSRCESEPTGIDGWWSLEIHFSCCFCVLSQTVVVKSIIIPLFFLLLVHWLANYVGYSLYLRLAISNKTKPARSLCLFFSFFSFFI